MLLAYPLPYVEAWARLRGVIVVARHCANRWKLLLQAFDQRVQLAGPDAQVDVVESAIGIRVAKATLLRAIGQRP